MVFGGEPSRGIPNKKLHTSSVNICPNKALFDIQNSEICFSAMLVKLRDGIGIWINGLSLVVDGIEVNNR